MVLRIAPPTPDSAKNSMKEICPLAAWCLEVGSPMEVRRVFTPDTIDRFIELELVGASAALRRTYRPNLRRVGRRLVPEIWRPEPQRHERPASKDPYSEEEVNGLLRLAEH